MDSKADFIVAAISDTQATIRAVDIKAAALLVAIMAPLTSVNRVFGHLDRFGGQSPCWVFFSIVVVFLVTWFLALYSLVRAIGAIDNPARHITGAGADSCIGAFYAGGLYTLGVADVFRNREIIRASIDSFSARIPDTTEAIERELVFEQMKLAYIRDIKLNRLKWGMRFSFVWLVLGIGIFLFSKYGV